MFFHDLNMPNLQEMDISCIGRYFGILPISSLMLYMHFQLWIYLWNKNRDVSLILKSHLIRVIPLHRKILNVSWHIMNIHIDYIWRYNDLLKISMILNIHYYSFIYIHIYQTNKKVLCALMDIFNWYRIFYLIHITLKFFIQPCTCTFKNKSDFDTTFKNFYNC